MTKYESFTRYSGILLLLLLIGCAEEIKPIPYTYSNVFTGENSKTWKFKFMEETLNGEVLGTFGVSCASDDKYIFYANADHTYEVNTGNTLCDTDELDSYVDSWTFNNASATLVIIIPFLSHQSLPFIVRQAKQNKLELEIFFDQANTGSYRIHFELGDED